MKSRATEWQEWGKRDPLWAVSSWKGKEHGGRGAWTADEFYRVGQQDWAGFQAVWEQYGLNKSSVVEIGCGSGRITRQLNRAFQKAFAIDVSSDQIRSARSVAPETTFFQVADSSIPLPDASVSAVFSSHVLQHLDPAMVQSYLAEAFRVLAAGGTAMLHIPVYAWPFAARYFEAAYRLRNRVRGGSARLARALLRFGIWTRYMPYRAYSAAWILGNFEQAGFRDIEIRIIRAASNGDPHPFVLARKADR